MHCHVAELFVADQRPARGTILRIPVEPFTATAVGIFKTDARSPIDTDRRQSLATGIHALRAGPAGKPGLQSDWLFQLEGEERF